jgi:hypothetical protein
MILEEAIAAGQAPFAEPAPPLTESRAFASRTRRIFLARRGVEAPRERRVT